MSQYDRDLKLYEALIKRRQEPSMPPEVLAELREWWEGRDREWREKLKAHSKPPGSSRE